MADDWGVAEIRDLAEIFDGPHATPRKTQSGPVFLGISNLSNGRLDLTSTEHLSEHDYERWTRRVTPEAGDVVFSYETRLGEAALIPEGLRCCLGRRMGLLRPRRDRVDPRFLLYAYLGPTFQETLRGRTIHGSTVDRIPLLEMGTFPLEMPRSLDEQRAIAHILGTLDDKIELNRRMSETLEAMARALFKAWFVDFDPVRAKAEGRETGLPKLIADLFPARLVDSAFGEVPEGWEVTTLGDLLELAYGKALKSDDRRDGEVPVFGANGQVGWHDERLVLGPGIVVGRKGNPGVVTWVPTDFFVIDTAFYVVPKGTCHSLGFFFHALRTQDLAALSADSAVPGLNRNLAYMSQQVMPPPLLLQRFEAVTRATAERVNSLSRESRALAAVRDALLPKLISGELRIEDAGESVGRGDRWR